MNETAEAPAKKKGFLKKEKKPKAPKPKKEKKPKAPKPKKEKKPKAPKPKKEKKPKAPKPKKEKKPKKAAAEGEDGGKGGKKKLLLILLPVVVVLAGAAVFLVTRVFNRMPSGEEDPEGAEVVELDAEADPDAETDPDAEGTDDETGGSDTTEPSDGVGNPLEIRTNITTSQVIQYLETLSPSLLGLEGESMADYEMFASDSVALVDGRYCTQVRIYSDSGAAGTNDIAGIYYLTRGSERKLYSYNEETDEVEEIKLY